MSQMKWWCVGYICGTIVTSLLLAQYRDTFQGIEWHERFEVTEAGFPPMRVYDGVDAHAHVYELALRRKP